MKTKPCPRRQRKYRRKSKTMWKRPYKQKLRRPRFLRVPWWKFRRFLLDFIKNELSADSDNDVAANESAESSAKNADTETENEIEIMPSEESEELMETYECSVVTDSDAEYRNTIINRLDNLLVCGMITACCAFLILFHTLKKE